MAKKKIWNVLKLFLKLAITGLSLYLVFRKVDPADMKEAFNRSNPFYFFVALLFFVASQVVSASRLNRFFRGIGLQISEWYNFKIYLLGMFYNLFLPGGIGGDGYKIFLLKRKFKIKARKLFQSIFFDRLSGLWALSVIICALGIFIPAIDVDNWILATLPFVGTAVYYFGMRRFFREYSTDFINKHIKALMVQSLQVISVIFLLYAFQFNGKFSPYLLMFLVSSLVAIFPFTVGGLGAREVVFLYGAQLFNLDPHIAVIISLLFYIISALLSLTGVYFVFRPQALGEKRIVLEPDEEV